MSKKIYSLWILGFITLILCSFFYFRSNRFYINNEKGDSSYKIDQWTGDTWLLRRNRQMKVEGNEEESTPQKITKAIAIEKVKEDRTLDYNFSNGFEIRSQLEDLEGSLKISGWEAEKVDEQTFLVSYQYENEGKTKGYYFEYNTEADLIRNVLNDAALQRKYNVGPLRPPSKEELQNLE